MVLNDRFEYETLWRYPIGDELTSASGGKNSFFETGRLNIFNDLDKIRYDMAEQYQKYDTNQTLAGNGMTNLLNRLQSYSATNSS